MDQAMKSLRKAADKAITEALGESAIAPAGIKDEVVVATTLSMLGAALRDALKALDRANDAIAKASEPLRSYASDQRKHSADALAEALKEVMSETEGCDGQCDTCSAGKNSDDDAPTVSVHVVGNGPMPKEILELLNKMTNGEFGKAAAERCAESVTKH